jgi:pyridinium-3,5-bisthiocarboxylic acid mononucleotide nickel chelatase
LLRSKEPAMTVKIAYLDCPTGVAGDMCLGALVEAGVPIGYLHTQLARLGIATEFNLRATQVHQNGQIATKVYVDLTASELMHDHDPREHHDHSHEPHDHSHDHSHDHDHHDHGPQHSRNLPEIERMIEAAGLPDRAARWSLAVFRNLAQAEGAVHGIPPEQVHFHEVGAVDAIVDIVGTCLGLDWLGIDALYCSPLPTGGGTVWAAHGRLPVPVPAVLKLWAMGQVPIYHNGIDRELVTPTGAAIVTTLAQSFGPPPTMVLQQVALGAGTLELPIPNLVRLWIGTTDREAAADPRVGGGLCDSLAATAHDHSPDRDSHNHNRGPDPGHNPDHPPIQTVIVLDTQIDDLNPQAIGYAFEQLFQAGAVDVFTSPIGMKKSRPGILLTVICPPDRAAACEQVIFAETSTLGIRRSEQQRTALARAFEAVQTAYGEVQVKVARSGGQVINVQPEYEDCAAIARSQKLPWRQVHQLALAAWSGGKLGVGADRSAGGVAGLPGVQTPGSKLKSVETD